MITDVLPLFAQNVVCCNLSLDTQALIKLLKRDIVRDPNRDFFLTKSHELHTLDEYNFISNLLSIIVFNKPIADLLKANGSLELVGFSFIIKNPFKLSILSAIETV